MEDFAERIEEDDEFREKVQELDGKILGCWCVPQLCHGHVILYYLEESEVPKSLKDIKEKSDEKGDSTD